MKVDVVQRAKEFAETMHQGQKRKDGTPYITHPAGVVGILEEVLGIWPLLDIPEENIVFSVGWLHDTLEDTATEYEELKRLFGKSIAYRVYLLSRNVDREKYKSRIKSSDYTVRLIKLADVLHNVHDPHSLSYLPAESVQRKIDDCKMFYIPLAMNTCQTIGYMLKESVNNYLKILGCKE